MPPINASKVIGFSIALLLIGILMPIGLDALTDTDLSTVVVVLGPGEVAQDGYTNSNTVNSTSHTVSVAAGATMNTLIGTVLPVMGAIAIVLMFVVKPNKKGVA